MLIAVVKHKNTNIVIGKKRNTDDLAIRAMLICIRIGWLMSYNELTKPLRGTLAKVKDPLPTLKQRNVVYQIQCSDLSDAYIGRTGRTLFTRLKEHIGTIRQQDENSLLALHCLTTGHAFDWDGASVIGKKDHQAFARF